MGWMVDAPGRANHRPGRDSPGLALLLKPVKAGRIQAQAPQHQQRLDQPAVLLLLLLLLLGILAVHVEVPPVSECRPIDVVNDVMQDATAS